MKAQGFLIRFLHYTRKTKPQTSMSTWPEHSVQRDQPGPTSRACSIIGTLKGVGGRGVGDYTSLKKPYKVLIMGVKAGCPPKGPYDSMNLDP